MSCFFSTVHVIRCGLLKATLLAALLTLLLAPGGPVFAQALPSLPYALPEGEAPPTLFSAQIGDSEVDFVLEGSWRTELAAALGLVITPEGLVYAEEFPGFGSLWPPVFRNFPRLTFTIWLRQRFFLESSVVWDFVENPSYDYTWWDKNYWLAGYRGMEGEFLRSVLVGNREVAVDPYPFLEVPETGSSSLGASALMGAGRSSHQLMLRYDNNEPAEAIFLGKNRVEESNLDLDGFIRGRFFRLPDAGVEDLEVYLEDPDGAYTGTDQDVTGGSRRYRLATVDDANLDAAGGTVTLKKASAGAVLVYYRVGVDNPSARRALGNDALPGDNGSGGLDLDAQPYWTSTWNSRTISARTWPTARYRSTAQDCPALVEAGGVLPVRDPGRLRHAGGRSRGGFADARAGAGEGQRGRPGELQREVPPHPRGRLPDRVPLRGPARDLRNLYPFIGPPAVFDPDNLLYGPNADPSAGYLQHQLRVSLLTPVSSFGLGSDVVPGSVQVLRNGVTENRFEFDPSLGAVEFLTEIAPDDRLVITFRRKQALAGNGDLLFIWGNTIPLGDAHTLQVATGLRWNVVPGTYTEEAYERTGSALVSAGLQGEVGPLRYEVSAAVGFTNPDTTGRMRLLGMEGQGREISLSESTAWPAAPPGQRRRGAGHPDRGEPGPASLQGPALRNRLQARAVRGFRKPRAGFRPGSRRAVGGYADSPGAGPGAGGPLGAGIHLHVVSRAEPDRRHSRAYLQIGEIGEDLDDDGTLDEEASASSAGFPVQRHLRRAASCAWAAAPRTWATAAATARTWTATEPWTRRTSARSRTWWCP